MMHIRGVTQVPDSAAPRRKGDKRERTRGLLIEAAAGVIAERGYERTSLEEVARRAGMSRGAIYGNFKDREELFMAVVTDRWTLPPSPFAEGRSLAVQMRHLGHGVAALARERRRMAVAAVSFQLYALTHEEMRARLEAQNAEIYRQQARALVASIRADELPMPPDVFVKVIHALIEGLTLTHFLTPDLITEEVIVAAFEALA